MKITEHNVLTNEVIERDATKAELDQRKIDQADEAVKAEAHAEKAAAKIALLERLGITEDEAKLLLG